MKDYTKKIETLIEGIQPELMKLAQFVFQGVGGDIEELRQAFISCYEAAEQGEKMYHDQFGEQPLPEPETWCDSSSSLEDIRSFYERLKSPDFAPGPWTLMGYQDYTMSLNKVFIALNMSADI